MSGTMMVIEALGRILDEKDRELQKQQDIIDKLTKKIDIFTQYIEVYESCLKKGEEK